MNKFQISMNSNNNISTSNSIDKKIKFKKPFNLKNL